MEGAYELAAKLNDEATTIVGIEHGSVLNPCCRIGEVGWAFERHIWKKTDQAGRRGKALQLHGHIDINGIYRILGTSSWLAS